MLSATARHGTVSGLYVTAKSHQRYFLKYDPKRNISHAFHSFVRESPPAVAAPFQTHETSATSVFLPPTNQADLTHSIQVLPAAHVFDQDLSCGLT